MTSFSLSVMYLDNQSKNDVGIRCSFDYTNCGFFRGEESINYFEYKFRMTENMEGNA